MASKSAAGRRKMHKAAQKSAAAKASAASATKFTLPPTPPRVPSPPPLFYHAPRSPSPAPPPSRPTFSSHPVRPQWTIPARPSSPSISSSYHALQSRITSATSYPSPPRSVSSEMTSPSVPVSPYTFSSPSTLPAHDLTISTLSSFEAPQRPQEYVSPSPSRRGNVNPITKTAPIPTHNFLKFGANKKGDSDSLSRIPSRFRALLSREKQNKKKNTRRMSFPPPMPQLPDNNPVQNRFVEQQYDTTDWFVENDTWIKKHETRLHPYQSDAPYPVAFDFDNLESDRFTDILLNRLNPNGSLSPSFHDYGSHPPMSVLDLGCGAGHWVRSAAKAWKPYGTMVTGFDLVDITQGVLSYGSDGSNFNLIRGNFLKHKLPFADESFDLVRLANISLAITYDKWDFVLWEARRVLRPGGRLEIIDDEIIFPYAVQSKSATSTAISSKSDIPMSSSLINLAPARPESRQRMAHAKDDDKGFYSSHNSALDAFPQPSARAPSIASTRSSQLTQYPDNSWERRASACQEMETIFESMLYNNLRIHPQPSEFLLDALKRVFGRRNSTVLRNMHLKLAPPELAGTGSHVTSRLPNQPRRLGGAPYSSLAAAAAAVTVQPNRRNEPQDTLGQSPGLLLWPDTFISVPPDELVQHACKHIETLLGCKSAIADFVELREDGVRVVDEEFWDAWNEYETFVRPRFDSSALSRVGSHAGSSLENAAVTESVQDYQMILGSRFEVGDPVLGGDLLPSDTRTLPGVSTPPSLPRKTSYSRNSPPSDTPPYTREELVHIRTIRVYEATKVRSDPIPF